MVVVANIAVGASGVKDGSVFCFGVALILLCVATIVVDAAAVVAGAIFSRQV